MYFVASAVLLYLLARRMKIRVPFAALTTVLFILSPLSLVLGRQVYLDNIGVPWLLLAFYLALSSREALWHHVGAGICFAVAVLSKETLAVFGPALLLALVYRPRWSNRSFSVVGFLGAGGLLLAFYPLSALLKNELVAGPDHVSLQDALSYQLLKRSGSGTIFEAGSSRSQLWGRLAVFRQIPHRGRPDRGRCLPAAAEVQDSFRRHCLIRHTDRTGPGLPARDVHHWSDSLPGPGARDRRRHGMERHGETRPPR